jgi:hypothetical protein
MVSTTGTTLLNSVQQMYGGLRHCSYHRIQATLDLSFLPDQLLHPTGLVLLAQHYPALNCRPDSETSMVGWEAELHALMLISLF